MTEVQIYLIVAAIILLVVALLCLILGIRIGERQGKRLEAADWEANKLKNTVAQRLKQSRAVIGGQVAEQIAPLLNGFPYDPGDCRFIGKPLDYLIFKGMNGSGISEVVFLEIKTGKSRLNEQEKALRDCIQAKRVRWEELNL